MFWRYSKVVKKSVESSILWFVVAKIYTSIYIMYNCYGMVIYNGYMEMMIMMVSDVGLAGILVEGGEARGRAQADITQAAGKLDGPPLARQLALLAATWLRGLHKLVSCGQWWRWVAAPGWCWSPLGWSGSSWQRVPPPVEGAGVDEGQVEVLVLHPAAE